MSSGALQKRASRGYTDEERIIQTELEQLYATTRDELLAYYTRKLPNAADAEDFVQRTFERMLTKDEITDPLALLRTVASALLANEYRDHVESVSYERLIGDGTGLDHLPQFQTYDYDDAAFADDHDLAVRELEEGNRAAYILGELRGLPSREAALLLGVSHVTAIARRESATSAIREEIAA